MKEVIEFILKNVLPAGADFNVTEHEDDMGIRFDVQIAEEFRGKIIGKAGRNIKALRDIISIIARREQKRVFIKIVD